MFKWLKSDPTKSLQKELDKKLEQAFLAQRNGKIELYSTLTQECEDIKKKIDQIKSENTSS